MRASSPRVGPLGPAELPAATQVLARAFRDNPLDRAVIGPDEGRRLRALVAGIEVHLPIAARWGWVVGAHDAEGLAGVLVAEPPFARPLPLAPLLDRLRIDDDLGDLERRFATIENLLGQLAVKDEHES